MVGLPVPISGPPFRQGLSLFISSNTKTINPRINMAIHLEANYSKKLGLPGYSSHQYSVTIKTEVTDPNQVPAESSRLYDMLQSCVDREIHRGFDRERNRGRVR
jgi:hypothetical protein